MSVSLHPEDVYPVRGSSRAQSFVGLNQLRRNANPQNYVMFSVQEQQKRDEDKGSSLVELIKKIKSCVSNVEFQLHAKEIIDLHFTEKAEQDKSLGLTSISPLDQPYDFILSDLFHFNGSSLNLEAVEHSLANLEYRARCYQSLANIYKEIISDPSFYTAPVDYVSNWMQVIQEKEMLTQAEKSILEFFKEIQKKASDLDCFNL